MKLSFDRAKCQGHNRCVMLAPKLFDADDEGYAVLLVDGDIDASEEENARLCADNCPEFAITLS